MLSVNLERQATAPPRRGQERKSPEWA